MDRVRLVQGYGAEWGCLRWAVSICKIEDGKLLIKPVCVMQVADRHL